MKISSGTIARTVVLILALVNQVLSVLGYKNNTNRGRTDKRFCYNCHLR